MLLAFLSAALLFAQEPAPATPSVDGVIGEAPIVAGNRAGARDRALVEAFKQLVDRTANELFAEAGVAPNALTPALQTLRAGWLQNPRRLIQRHQLLEEAEIAGRVRVRVTAEVNEARMRAELDRARGTVTRIGTGAGVPLLAAGPPEGGAALAGALAAAGVAVEVQKADAARVGELAARSGRGVAILVSAQTANEGPVRGTDQLAVECHLSARVVPAPPAAPGREHGGHARGYRARDADARAACFSQAASELVAAILPELGVARGGAGQRVLTVDLDVTEPAALIAVLRALRRTGGVSAAEVRRVIVGRAELQVSTRQSPDALVTALGRALAREATLERRAAEGERVSLAIRLLPPPSPAAPTPLGPPELTGAQP